MSEFKKKLTDYYNKFNEEKRLSRRHGQVEYITSMKYIHEYIKEDDSVLDVGAGAGRYSIALKNEGYNVTAVELTKPNIGKIKTQDKELKVIEADARDLNKINDESFDIVILFGPLYHLHSHSDKLKALLEARRVVKKGGYIFAAYIMMDYSIVYHAFIKDNYRDIKESLDENYNVLNTGNDLYSYVRIDEVRKLSREARLKNIKTVAADGPSDYIRPVINKMDDETFKAYVEYHLKTCELPELLGASSHIVDILQK